jgi:hypothetical protein
MATVSVGGSLEVGVDKKAGDIFMNLYRDISMSKNGNSADCMSAGAGQYFPQVFTFLTWLIVVCLKSFDAYFFSDTTTIGLSASKS